LLAAVAGGLGAGVLAASFQAAMPTWSRALPAHRMTWNASAQRTAVGQRRDTTAAIQSAESALTWVI
jgi:hypothetical protein